jgi:hypothetical protein
VSLTTVLAIYAACLSTVTVALALIRERQNRPDLRVALSWGIETDPHPEDPGGRHATIAVEAVNAGRHPTTVLDAYVIWDPPDGPGEILLDRDDDEPKLLGPNQTARWTQDIWGGMVFTHVDIPARARLTDGLGHEIWSEPELVLRYFVSLGWEPRATNPDLLEARPELRVAKPLYPRWQLWRRKDLRTATRVDYDDDE